MKKFLKLLEKYGIYAKETGKIMKHNIYYRELVDCFIDAELGTSNLTEEEKQKAEKELYDLFLDENEKDGF